MAKSNLLSYPSCKLPLEQQHQMVCEFLGLPEEGWEMVDEQIACSSKTWMHQDWVLQQRPRVRYRRMNILYQASLQMDGLLAGFQYHGPLARIQEGGVNEADGRWLDADSFWIAQPRLHGKSLFELDASPRMLLERLRRAAPKVAHDLQLFNGQDLRHFDLFHALPTHGIIQQNSNIDTLMNLVEIDPALQRIVDQISWAEPDSEPALSHGDPTLKNLVETDSSIELIDWESVWILPRHRDFTHQVAFLCKYLPGEYWQEAMDIVWDSAKEQLPDWHQNIWHQACVWQLLREVIFFPPEGEQAYQDFLSSLQDLIDQRTF